jgi:hypothetical protein
MQLYAVTRPDVAAAAKSQDFLETGFELLLADEAVAHLVRSGCLLAEDAPGVYFILRGSLEGTTNEDACRQAGWLIERGSFL